MMEPAPEQLDALKVYCNCLQSLKIRLELIDSIASGKLRISNESIDYEFVCLQLRKALELIAFASVAAHKDVYSQVYADFATHWNAKKLLKKLEALHPQFYPKPGQLLAPDEKGVRHVEEIKDGFLRKEDFIFLYDTCSEVLHEWNPYRQDPRVVHFGHPIDEWVKRIVRLLDFHYIQLVDTNVIWLVRLNDPETGNVRGFFLQDKDARA